MPVTEKATAAKRPVDVVRDHLAHYLGPFTAKSAVNLGASQTLKVSADAITKAQVPALLDALGPTLRTLLGKPTTEKVIAEIRQELGV